MKPRTNGILIGTILIVLVGALIFVQSQFMAPSEEEEEPAAPPGINTPGHKPSVDELNNRIPGTGRGPTTNSPIQNSGPSPMKVH